MSDGDQVHSPDYSRDGRAQAAPERHWPWLLQRIFKRPFVVTARVLIFALTAGWIKFWRKRPGSKPPHWAKDLLDIFDWFNLVPTFFIMALAPWHFFRRAAQIRNYGSTVYKTPIKFVVSAVPFIVGLHWLAVGSLYKFEVVRSLRVGFRTSLWGFVNFDCCEELLYALSRAFVRGEHWVRIHTELEVVSRVLLGIPIWMPLLSGFIAITLLFPYALVNAAESLLLFLIPLDPKTYLRIRLSDYFWNALYFAVYFTLAFPFCLLALYGIYHEFLYPSSRLMRIGFVNLWFTATSVSFVASLLIGPYSELLQASVVIPTPLMLKIRLSKLGKLIKGIPICIKIAQKGNVSPLERAIDSCNYECKKLRAMNGRLTIAAANAGDRWKRKLATDMKKAFSGIRAYDLSQADYLPLSPLCKEQTEFVSDFLLSNGANNLPEVVLPKPPFLRRLVRRALILFGIALAISVILLIPIWWFGRK